MIAIVLHPCLQHVRPFDGKREEPQSTLCSVVSYGDQSLASLFDQRCGCAGGKEGNAELWEIFALHGKESLGEYWLYHRCLIVADPAPMLWPLDINLEKALLVLPLFLCGLIFAELRHPRVCHSTKFRL